MLKETYYNLLEEFGADKKLMTQFWKEIELQHSHKKRHYHTLNHLNAVLEELHEVKSKISNWNTVLFTLYYHDIIYNATKSNNEEKSAELAKLRLKEINVPEIIITVCSSQILATKTHILAENSDTNYFTDADLSILGSDWNTYAQYFQNVRKEYNIYPNLVYNPGRKKVLNHFLSMEFIYKTEYFRSKYEKQAKINLTKELVLL